MATEIYSIQSALIVTAIVIGGFLIMLGRRHAGGRIIFATFLIAFAAPFVVPIASQYLNTVPVEVLAILGAILGLLMLQAIVSVVFGRRVGDSVTASLLTSLLKIISYPIVGPMRWIGQMLRRLGN